MLLGFMVLFVFNVSKWLIEGRFFRLRNFVVLFRIIMGLNILLKIEKLEEVRMVRFLEKSELFEILVFFWMVRFVVVFGIVFIFILFDLRYKLLDFSCNFEVGFSVLILILLLLLIIRLLLFVFGLILKGRLEFFVILWMKKFVLFFVIF